MLLDKRKSAVFGKRENQEGITIVEISVGLAIIAVLAIFLAPRAGALFGKARVELAQQEMITLVTAAQQYRQAEQGYDSISLEKLDTDGYHIEPFSGSNAKNAYGKDIGLSVDSETAKFIYPVEEASDCNQLKIRLDSLNPVDASCADTVLTVTVR